MRAMRYTIASLTVLIFLVAVDLAWLRYVLHTRRSLLGFAYEGCDLALLPMANVLAFGIFRLGSRAGERRAFLIGFELAGLVALVGVAAAVRIAPDATNSVVSAAFDPLWSRTLGWVPRGTILQLVVGMFIISISYGLPEVLLALVGGLLARRVARQRRRGNPGEPSTASDAVERSFEEDRRRQGERTALPLSIIGAATA